MTDEEVKLVLGGLLHDIGKVIYREGNDRRKHSKSGYDFLKEELQITDVKKGDIDHDILNCVLYHHADALKNAKLSDNALAYIIYMADNIASSADRRKTEQEDTGFEIAMPLQSVFNILNGNSQKFYYKPGTLENDINFPGPEKRLYEPYFYSKVMENLKANLAGLEWTQEYINSLLEVLEANLSFVPSSTAKDEMADVSLYDHMKLTAAFGSCIYQYCKENDIHNYKERLFTNGRQFYSENAFLLFSMDISGIQDFIYTITSEGALKTLRARSFYLEIMMEHIVDSLLFKLHLSRANLLYTGGGHSYIILPNTKDVITTIEQYMNELNDWLKKLFDISLYVAYGYAPCSSDVLKNMPDGSYSELFRKVGEKISDKKMHRYDAKDILSFNRISSTDHSRECKICHRLDRLGKDDTCTVCNSIKGFSKNILYSDFFAVSSEEKEDRLPLPGGYYLSAENKESLKKRILEDDHFVRAYCKNQLYTGKQISTKLWVGSYTSKKEFAEMAEEADGIDRIGVLRADVDNLGQAIVNGFENRYKTLSRTATLSRQLSMFFKWYINDILENPKYFLGKESKKRNASICYSGGDDVFIVGAWNDVIGLSIDMVNAFRDYTQDTLTLSGGIGIYSDSYPVSAFAKEVQRLEEKSKNYPGKKAVTLFEDGVEHIADDGKYISDGTYTWTDLQECVLGEKYKVVSEFFEQSEERGKNFLYNLLELIRTQDEVINFARYVYLIARLEPGAKASKEEKMRYTDFSAKMYGWIKSEKDRRELKTAINIYAYLTREKEIEKNADK